jgi:hypothetical protein
LLGIDLASFFSPVAAGPHFEKRNVPAPELPGVRTWVGKMNPDSRPPKAVLQELRAAKIHFSDLIRNESQTKTIDSEVSRKLINPILRSENARTPGLNAVACSNEEELGKALRKLSRAGGPGQEGHVRFHLGVENDTHRVAVDAFRHRDGGFTLVAVESLRQPILTKIALKTLSERGVIEI